MKIRTLLLLIVAAVSTSATFAQTTPTVVRAQLVARNTAVLSAEIGARIRQLHVLEGSTFLQGDPLVSFDDTLQRAQLQRAEAVLAGAERAFASNQRLFRLNSIGQVELDLSETELGKARAELAYARAMLSKCQLVAPFSGRVAEQRAHEQEFVQPGQTLLELIGGTTPEVDFIAPSKWLAWLHVGQAIEVTVDETGRTYSARVERIGARVDPVSQSIKIVAGIDQSAPELVTGMTGTISTTPEKVP